MWTLPGYGDHLEEKSPGLREGMKEMGAPEDFEDVVASVTPIPADQPDTPPHWSLTFAVDEADDIAAKAEELGGKVVVPAVRRPVGADGGDRRPAGSDVRGQQVRAGEPRPRAGGGRSQRRLGGGAKVLDA